MKIFTDSPESWSEKVNFVDRNNVVVGYDMCQSCCETADWYITADKRSEVPDCPEKLKAMHAARALVNVSVYDFDPDYFEKVDGADVDEGGMVRFRLVHQADPLRELWLHVFNAHNGYYAHGFTFKNGETVIRKGDL